MQFLRAAFFAIAVTGLAHGPDKHGTHWPGKHSGHPVTSLVDVGYAKYKGTTLKADVNQFLGIRFAAPPLGDMRWRAPAPPKRVAGIQSAEEVSLSSNPVLHALTRTVWPYLRRHDQSCSWTQERGLSLRECLDPVKRYNGVKASCIHLHLGWRLYC